ncbi:MAG: electron transfer flavoprotein subunit beta/FixA family protein [Spirochaetes bacterium]|nr:electron transfer flavoprotein subunit beta/FixA family protein [Spirochaetota bacterium]
MGIDVLVCMKQVPDTQKVRIDPERGTLIRKGVPSITNPFCESALELALGIREKRGGTVTVLTMGIPDAACILKDALSLGADRAILVTGRDFAGADTLATSYALSRAVSSLGGFDLLLFGKQAIDGDTAQVGPEVAGMLGIPVVTFVTDIRKITPGGIVVERAADGCRELVRTRFPSLLTVVRAEKRLRMPTMEGILSSFSREVETAGLGDIGAESDRCGLKGSPTRVKKIFSPSNGGLVNFLEGSVEEKAIRFVELLKEKGFVR